MLIVGANRIGQRVPEMLREDPWSTIQVYGYVDDTDTPAATDFSDPLLGGLADVDTIIQREAIKDVGVSLPQEAYRKINQVVVSLQDLPVEVRLVPDHFSLSLYRAQAAEFGGLSLISLRDPALNASQRIGKDSSASQS